MKYLAGAIAIGFVLPAALAGQDGKDAPARTKSAVEKTRARKSYSVSFKAEIRAPDSDPLSFGGETLWVAPGVLFTQYTTSGGEKVRVVRAGEKVWWYHMVAEDWFPAEEVGKPGAGRGVQNPDDVLSAVIQAVDQAVPGAKGAVDGKPVEFIDMKLDGNVLQRIMRSQAASGSFDWVKSAGTVKLGIGTDDGQIHQMQVAADVVSSDPALKGKKVGYSADVKLKSYNRDFAMDFSDIDLKTKQPVPIPVPKAFLDEVEKLKGIPDELKAEIQRRRQK